MYITNSFIFDKYVTLFSQEGRLFQIEYAYKASNCSGLNCIGMKGIDTVCGILEFGTKNFLSDSYHLAENFFTNNNLGYICNGIAGDVMMFNNHITDEICNYFEKSKQDIPVEYLVGKISEKAQLNTQYIFTRPWGICAILLGVDENLGPRLYKIDPSGYSSSQVLCAIGEKENEVNNHITKKMKQYFISNFSHLSTVINLILLFQCVLKYDVKATNVKMIIATTKKRIKVLDSHEIDAYLLFIENFLK